ncbi:MAG TPA: hypothetical protein VK543_01540, partial [Puia sp.]|nr:hypothetical protein [Puia sp.]
EEIYHLLNDQNDDLCVKQFNKIENWDIDIINKATILKNYISKVRDFKAANNIKPSEKIESIGIPYGLFQINNDLFEIARRQTNSKNFHIIIGPLDQTRFGGGNLQGIHLKTKEEFNELNKTSSSTTTTLTSIPINGYEFLLAVNQTIDLVSKKAELLKDLQYLKGFLISVEKKLNNERFIQNAQPEVIYNEKKKKEDAALKIKAIQESLANMD